MRYLAFMRQRHGEQEATEPHDLTLHEAAAFLRLSVLDVFWAVAMRQVPHRRQGCRVYIRRDELLRALATGGDQHGRS